MSEKKVPITCRQVIQLKNGKIVNIFPSIRGMCIEIGVDRRAVIRVLNKEPNFRSVRGWSFEYADPDIPVDRYKVGAVYENVVSKYKSNDGE